MDRTSEVSYNELSRTVGADKATVSNYIDLLEQAFLIYKLPPFARNQRTEISSSRKIFFADNVPPDIVETSSLTL